MVRKDFVMEYLKMLERVIRESAVYREFLMKLPSPFNNVDFVLLLSFLLGILLILKAVDLVRMRFRHKRLMKRQEAARAQSQADRLLREEEARVQQGKLAAFMQYMQMQARPKEYAGDAPKQRKGLGGRLFRIGSTHSANDFEILMEEAKKNDDE